MTVSAEGVLQRIKQAARIEGRDVQSMVTLYVIQRFVARLIVVDAGDSVTIKGGQSMGMLFGFTARPTKDLDINIQVPEGEDGVVWAAELLRAACLVPLDDGVHIDLARSDFERREHQGDGGLRVTLTVSVSTCRAPFVIDVGMDNEMSFDPTEMDVAGVLDGQKAAPARIRVRIYPLENTIAEKIVSKLEDGNANIRHKDFFDLWFAFEVLKRVGEYRIMAERPEHLPPQERAVVLAVRKGILDGSMLSLPERPIEVSSYERLAFALSRTAESRGTGLPDDLISHFRSQFGDDAVQSTQWANWARNNRKRLLFQPPGTEQGVDRESAIHLLIDELSPFLSEIDERLPFIRKRVLGGVLAP